MSDGTCLTVHSLKPAPGIHGRQFVATLRADRPVVASSESESATPTPPSGWVSPHPRGPRSGLGCSVPVHHHLIDPIRPTRRHVRISPLCDLYRRLRCAGAPKRPTSGSELSLSALYEHVVLYDPGDPMAAIIQFLHHRRWPSRGSENARHPQQSHNPLHVGHAFRGFPVCFRYDLSVCLPPSADLTGSPQPTETFTSRLSMIGSPVPR